MELNPESNEAKAGIRGLYGPWDDESETQDKPLLGLATTAELLAELEVRMRVTQNSLNGRELGRLCSAALVNLDKSVLNYRTVDG